MGDTRSQQLSQSPAQTPAGSGHCDIRAGQYSPCRDQPGAPVQQNHRCLPLLHFTHQTALQDPPKAVQKERTEAFLGSGFSLGAYFFSTVPVPSLQVSVYTQSFTLSSHALAGLHVL